MLSHWHFCTFVLSSSPETFQYMCRECTGCIFFHNSWRPCENEKIQQENWIKSIRIRPWEHSIKLLRGLFVFSELLLSTNYNLRGKMGRNIWRCPLQYNFSSATKTALYLSSNASYLNFDSNCCLCFWRCLQLLVRHRVSKVFQLYTTLQNYKTFFCFSYNLHLFDFSISFHF